MLVAALKAQYEGVSVTTREAGAEAVFLNEDWIGASFTPPDARTTVQQNQLAISDVLAREVLDADILILSVSMYNFNIAGALKTWIDQIARPGLTFRPDPEHTYVGLATGKTAYLVVATGEHPSKGTWTLPRLTSSTCFGFWGLRM